MFDIILTPINMTTVANASDLVGSVFVPYVLRPKGVDFVQTLNRIQNGSIIVGAVYFNTSDALIHISGDQRRPAYFTVGATNAGIPYGASIVYTLTH